MCLNPFTRDRQLTPPTTNPFARRTGVGRDASRVEDPEEIISLPEWLDGMIIALGSRYHQDVTGANQPRWDVASLCARAQVWDLTDEWGSRLSN